MLWHQALLFVTKLWPYFSSLWLVVERAREPPWRPLLSYNHLLLGWRFKRPQYKLFRILTLILVFVFLRGTNERDDIQIFHSLYQGLCDKYRQEPFLKSFLLCPLFAISGPAPAVFSAAKILEKIVDNHATSYSIIIVDT